MSEFVGKVCWGHEAKCWMFICYDDLMGEVYDIKFFRLKQDAIEHAYEQMLDGNVYCFETLTKAQS